MAFLERLQMIIDADASGAAREFKKVGNTADRELGKATKSIDKMGSKLTSFGAGAVVGAAALGAGLAMFAREAAAAETQQLKLTNSIKNSSAAFPGNGKALRDQASALMKVTVADDDAIVSAQALLVQFGRTSKETEALTPLVVDLSRKMGIDLESAAKAVGKASDGSSGALKKMGIEVVDLGGGATATQNTIAALASSVGGFAESEGQTFAGQMEIMKNKFGELKESIGKGVLDVVTPVANIGLAFDGVSPKIGEAAGKIGTIGAAGSLAVGGISILAGQAIKLRSVFTTVSGEGLNATRSVTGFGKAAGALGLVAATALVADFAFGILNAGQIADNTAGALDDLKISLAGGGKNAGSVIDSFGGLVAAEQNTYRLSNLWQEFGAEISIGSTGVKADIEQVQTAFNLLGKQQGTKAQLAVLDELEKATNKLDKNSDQYKTNKEFIDKNRDSVEKAGKAQEITTKATEDATIATEEATVSTKDYDRQLKFIADTQKLGADRAAAYTKAIEDSSALDDQATAAFGMNDAYKGLFNTLNDLPKQFDPIKAALGDYTDEQNKAVESVITFGEKAGSVLEQAISTGGDPRFLGGIFRDRLTEVLKNAGIPPEQIAEYIGLAGLSEIQIEAAVTLSLKEEEKQKFYNLLALFQTDLDAKPPEIKIAVQKAIDAGEFAMAELLVKAFTGQLSPAELKLVLGANPNLAPELNAAIATAQAQADGNPIKIPVNVLAPNFNNPPFPMPNTIPPGGRNTTQPPAPGLQPPSGGGTANPFPPSTNSGGSDGNPWTPYAKGGSVMGGRTIQVNERGRELFTPNSNGFIMNAGDAQALIQGVSQIVSGGGGRGMTNNITINETSSPRQTALEVIRANKASLFLAGAL